jgi:hypothetical protein
MAYFSYHINIWPVNERHINNSKAKQAEAVTLY